MQSKSATLAKEKRLHLATAWIANFKGKNLIKGYRRHFGTDWLSSISELRSLGVEISAGYECINEKHSSRETGESCQGKKKA